MDAMSPETRAMVTSTLFTPLGEMKCQMDLLEEIVASEVVRQFELANLDLKTLYHAADGTHRSHRRKKGEASLDDQEHKFTEKTWPWTGGSTPKHSETPVFSAISSAQVNQEADEREDEECIYLSEPIGKCVQGKVTTRAAGMYTCLGSVNLFLISAAQITPGLEYIHWSDKGTSVMEGREYVSINRHVGRGHH
ncbi:hypothetical protein DXG01_015380 [Tephrocybe rancida]|nr:hypothetical protein DXG01_015380 [Tephrocybe rancida]